MRLFKLGSLVGDSGQAWKFHVGFVAMMAAFLVMVIGVRDGSLGTTLVGATAGLGAAAAACLSIQCPRCKTKWLWTAVRTQDHRQWLAWLQQQRTCPKCGHEPGGRPAA